MFAATIHIRLSCQNQASGCLGSILCTSLNARHRPGFDAYSFYGTAALFRDGSPWRLEIVDMPFYTQRELLTSMLARWRPHETGLLP